MCWSSASPWKDARAGETPSVRYEMLSMIAELESQTLIVEERSGTSEKVMRRSIQTDNAPDLICSAVHRSYGSFWLKQLTSFL